MKETKYTRTPKYHRKSSGNLLKWVGLIGIPAGGLIALKKFGILTGDTFHKTAVLVGVLLFIIGVAVIMYGWENWWKRLTGLILKTIAILALLIVGVGGAVLVFGHADPFTVMIGGNDQEGEISAYGRTDVNILAGVNPNTGTVALISLPRDLFIPNPDLDYYNDKLTHLGNSGIENTQLGVANWSGEEVDHYALINFTVFTQLIDAIGGVDIDNPYTFTFSWEPEVTFEEGKIHLNGEEALLYVRERYSLPNGDFDRNEHQQIVMKAILKKMISLDGIKSLPTLYQIVNDNIITDMTPAQILLTGCKMAVHFKNLQIVSSEIDGSTSYEYCASIPDQPVSVVWPDDESAAENMELLNSVLDGTYQNSEALETAAE